MFGPSIIASPSMYPACGVTKENGMKTEWSHLPNAKYIDMILADLKEDPKKWSDAWESARTAASDAAWLTARTAVSDAAWLTARTIIWDRPRPIADSAAVARGAILALIAYDDCGYLLNEKPEHVWFLSLLGNNTAATLLYPACVALQRKMA